MRASSLILVSGLCLAATFGCGCHSETGGTGGAANPAYLPTPAAGQGFQFGTPEFTVPSGTEEQDCYFFQVSALEEAAGLDPTANVNLHHVQVAQRIGSHHMNIFRVRTIVNLGPAGGAVQKGTNGVGQCFNSANWADWPLVANSQEEGDVDWTFPDGVANVIEPTEWLMLQTHFVNAATQQTPADGQVTVNFLTIPDSEVKQEMGTIFATKQSIRICESNPTPTFSGSCNINSPSPVQIIAANGHFHSRGKTFDMFTWDGTSTTTPPASQQFYQSTEWAEPPMLHSPQLDVSVPGNGGVFYTCSYEWVEPPPSVGCAALDAYDEKKWGTSSTDVDCCYTFGPQVDINEHCNAFVYYYPKQDNVNCF